MVREFVLRARKLVRGLVLPVLYRFDLRRPLDPDLVVHGAYWNRGVACNPAAIHAKALELVPRLRHVWVVGSRHVGRVPVGVECVVAGSRAYWRVMATATYLVNNSSFPGGFRKRAGQVYLQTHHGTPLKSMGLDQRRYPASARGMDFEKVLAHVGQWDFSLAANPHAAEVWDRVYPGAYEHLHLGQPRNDRYSTATSDDVAAIRASLGIASGARVLLYAPTHRDDKAAPFAPPLDPERFVREAGDEYVLLVRAHYFHGSSARLARAHPRVMDVTAHPRVEDLCLVADALITDYSSLLFDYACLDRPIVVHAPDWEAYRATRGTYFDLLSGRPGDTPGAVSTSDDELIALFRDGGWDSEASGGLREAFRARFCPYDDGHAAERVVRRLFLDERPRAGGYERSRHPDGRAEVTAPAFGG